MKQKFENFKRALERLKEALRAEPTGLNLDASIQRFEFTYELVWNVFKAFLFKDGIECQSPRECIKEAFRMGYIDQEDVWLKMIDDRNLSSHVYDEKEVQGIYQRVKTLYLPQFELVREKLGGRL